MIIENNWKKLMLMLKLWRIVEHVDETVEDELQKEEEEEENELVRSSSISPALLV